MLPPFPREYYKSKNGQMDQVSLCIPYINIKIVKVKRHRQIEMMFRNIYSMHHSYQNLVIVELQIQQNIYKPHLDHVTIYTIHVMYKKNCEEIVTIDNKTRQFVG